MKPKIKFQLSTLIFIGFAIGILFGVIFGENVSVIRPVGDLFIKLIKMIVVPLITCTIIHGVSNLGDITKLRRIGTKILAYYIFTTFCAATVGIAVSHIVKPGANFNMENVDSAEIQQADTPAFSEALLDMVPSNPIESLASGNLIQIIVFSVLVGVSITIAGEKAVLVKKFFDGATEVVYKLTNLILATAPVGVTALIADSVGTHGLKIFGPLGKLILADYLGAIIILLVVYTSILKFVVKINLKEFFCNIIKVWTVTASTTSSSATLPVSMKVAREDFGAPEEIVGFTMPLGATINMDGAANYFAIAVIFAAQAYNISMPISQQIITVLMATLFSIGAPGIMGGGIVLTIMLLNTMGLPLEIMGLVAAIYRIIDIGHTTLNVTGDVIATLFISKSEKMWSPIKKSDQ